MLTCTHSNDATHSSRYIYGKLEEKKAHNIKLDVTYVPVVVYATGVLASVVTERSPTLDLPH